MPTDEVINAQEDGQRDGSDAAADVPEWVKDPAKAYAEIRKTREEAKKLREERAALAAEGQSPDGGKTYRQLAEQYRAEADALKSRAEQAEQSALRVKVAAEAGIAPVLAARLVGQSEDDLKADAQALKALLASDASAPKRSGPQGTTPIPRGGPQGETDEQRRARLFGRGAGHPIFEKRNGGG